MGQAYGHVLKALECPATVVGRGETSAKAFEDPFFSSTPELIEDSARPIAGETIAKYADIVPTIPMKADVNAIVLAAGDSALRSLRSWAPNRAITFFLFWVRQGFL